MIISVQEKKSTNLHFSFFWGPLGKVGTKFMQPPNLLFLNYRWGFGPLGSSLMDQSLMGQWKDKCLQSSLGRASADVTCLSIVQADEELNYTQDANISATDTLCSPCARQGAGGTNFFLILIPELPLLPYYTVRGHMWDLQ